MTDNGNGTDSSVPIYPEGTEADSPALFTKCVRSYDAMHSQAIKTREGLVFEGALTALLQDECGYSQGYYSKIVGTLKAIGCIEQYKRGGGGSLSIWILHKRPTMEEYILAPSDTTHKATAISDQRFRDLNERLTRAEQTIVAQTKVLATFQAKLDKLEGGAVHA